ACSRPPALSSYWLVSISLISPSEKNCSPTTPSSTPRGRSGRAPNAWPRALSTRRDTSPPDPSAPRTRPRPPQRAHHRRPERPVPIAADERDRQQVEEATDVPLDAVARATVFPRPMVDGQLGGPKAAVVREHRDEAVKLAVEAHPLHDLGAVRLEAAIHVVE